MNQLDTIVSYLVEGAKENLTAYRLITEARKFLADTAMAAIGGVLQE